MRGRQRNETDWRRRSSRLAIFLLATCVWGCGGPPRGTLRDPESDPITPGERQAALEEVARATWTRGVYLREQGDLAGAVRLFGEAVRIAPQDPELRLAYSQLLVDAGRFREAAEFTRAAIGRFGGDAREHLMLGRLALLGGDKEAALAAADSALGRDSTLVDAWTLRGRLLLEMGRNDAALESYQRADSLQPDTAATLEGLAEAAGRTGQDATQQATLERALRLDPSLLEARRALAAIYRRQGRGEEATALVTHGLQLDPDDPARLEWAVETLVGAGDLETAARILGPYQKRQALRPPLAYTYGRILVQLDRLSAADSVLRTLTDAAGLRGVHSLLGDIAARQERLDDAVAHYRAAVQAEPEDCVPRASLALLAAQAQRAGTAAAPGAAGVDSLLAAADAKTSDEAYRCNLLLGLAYMALKRFPDAARRLEKAHTLDPENREVMFDLAMATAESGDTHAALDLARELLRRDAEDAATLNLVGYLLAERGEELAESESLIRRAVQKEPENGYYVDSLGWVLYQKGDHAGAVVALERAVRLTKEKDAVVLEHLGDAYVKAGHLAEARRTYARARNLDPARGALTSKLAEVDAKLGRP